ncbi:hypothetical protein [Bowmanella denitrificans]|uniref:hypothetical protein n=1 Tax=Bowmanella denitrificans TaxID=366582 RepID=UPI000C9B6E4E|nr:hypothetical protein [Bowmanella denitrificans]
MQHQSDSLNKLAAFSMIALAPNPWFSQWMNRQQLLSRMGQFAEVLYSNGLPYSWQLPSPAALFKQPTGRTQHTDNVQLYLPSSLQFRMPKLPVVDRWAMRHFGQRLSRYTNRQKQRVLYIFHPAYSPYMDVIDHDILVYHPYDNFSKQGEFSQELRHNEARLMKSANLVITPSVGVSSELGQTYGRAEVETVHNGVDFAHFSAYAATDNRPRTGQKTNIAYIGSINLKLDMDALLWIAKHISHATLHLVGPVGQMGAKQAAFDQLKAMPNVQLHGPKSHMELPAIAATMDCLLMCYDTSPSLWAQHAYPLKLNEYLAVKKPVVSCPLPSVPGIEHYVDIAATPSEWQQRIDGIIAGNYHKTEAGFEYASRQDWMTRVAQIAELLDTVK